jgi:hypothetical protein
LILKSNLIVNQLGKKFEIAEIGNAVKAHAYAVELIPSI